MPNSPIDCRLPANVVPRNDVETLLTPPLEVGSSLIADVVSIRESLEKILLETAAERAASIVSGRRPDGRRR